MALILALPVSVHTYLRWSKQNVGSFPFASCIRKLRGVTKASVPVSIFKPGGWTDALYGELCTYTHSRPDASDGQMWRSNGPIYVAGAFNLVFELQASTYAACYVRPRSRAVVSRAA
jgi:hypothetical protein